MATSSIETSWTDSKESRDIALSLWKGGPSRNDLPTANTDPILPVAGGRNILITSTLLPVAKIPHLGDIVSTVLSADVFNRYCQQRGMNTLFIGGVNDHCTSTEDRALNEQLSVHEINDKYHQLHLKLYKWLNVKFSVFGRTENKENTRLTQDIFLKLYEKNLINTVTVKQLYCEHCNRLLIEGQVTGDCPICSVEDIIKNDKCKWYNHALTSPTLLKCGICTSKSSTYRHTSQLATSDGALISRCGQEVGVALPLDEYNDRVFSEEFESAIAGYMSITAAYTDQWEKWWGCGSEVELYQFMSKDHTSFHSLLNELNTKYITPTGVSAIEHLLYEEGQFSSMHSIGLYGNDAMTTGIPSDLYRFYLMYIRPENEVSSFNWSSFALTINTDLINNIGTFINRTLVFIEDYCSSKVPQYTAINDRDVSLFVSINHELNSYHHSMERQLLKDGLKHVLNISRLASEYLQREEPRRLINNDRDRTHTLVHISVNVVYVLAVMLGPFTPSVSRDILKQLKVPPDNQINIPTYFSQYITSGHIIGEPRPLFMTLDDSRISLLRDKYSGKYSK